jgi:phage terminase large subunit-like protein
MVEPWPPRWLTPVPEEALAAGKGQLAIDFIEAFGVITKDSIAGNAGTPLILRDWQKDLIRHIYAGDGDGGYNQIQLIGLPRKSGKSAVSSTLALRLTCSLDLKAERFIPSLLRRSRRELYSLRPRR